MKANQERCCEGQKQRTAGPRTGFTPNRQAIDHKRATGKSHCGESVGPSLRSSSTLALRRQARDHGQVTTESGAGSRNGDAVGTREAEERRQSARFRCTGVRADGPHHTHRRRSKWWPPPAPLLWLLSGSGSSSRGTRKILHPPIRLSGCAAYAAPLLGAPAWLLAGPSGSQRHLNAPLFLLACSVFVTRTAAPRSAAPVT